MLFCIYIYICVFFQSLRYDNSIVFSLKLLQWSSIMCMLVWSRFLTFFVCANAITVVTYF